MTTEDGTQGGSRNVVRKFTLQTVQNTQNQKSVLIPRWKSEIKNSTNKSSLNPLCEYERIVCSRCELLSLRWSFNELVFSASDTARSSQQVSLPPQTHTSRRLIDTAIPRCTSPLGREFGRLLPSSRPHASICRYSYQGRCCSRVPVHWPHARRSREPSSCFVCLAMKTKDLHGRHQLRAVKPSVHGENSSPALTGGR
jgi:hypothetical protein